MYLIWKHMNSGVKNSGVKISVLYELLHTSHKLKGFDRD